MQLVSQRVSWLSVLLRQTDDPVNHRSCPELLFLMFSWVLHPIGGTNWMSSIVSISLYIIYVLFFRAFCILCHLSQAPVQLYHSGNSLLIPSKPSAAAAPNKRLLAVYFRQHFVAWSCGHPRSAYARNADLRRQGTDNTAAPPYAASFRSRRLHRLPPVGLSSVLRAMISSAVFSVILFLQIFFHFQ